jgi:hypothetical protein
LLKFVTFIETQHSYLSISKLLTPPPSLAFFSRANAPNFFDARRYAGQSISRVLSSILSVFHGVPEAMRQFKA